MAAPCPNWRLSPGLNKQQHCISFGPHLYTSHKRTSEVNGFWETRTTSKDSSVVVNQKSHPKAHSICLFLALISRCELSLPDCFCSTAIAKPCDGGEVWLLTKFSCLAKHVFILQTKLGRLPTHSPQWINTGPLNTSVGRTGEKNVATTYVHAANQKCAHECVYATGKSLTDFCF